MPALLVLAALLVSGAVAATSPSSGRDAAPAPAVQGDVVSLADGVEVAALPAPDVAGAEAEAARVDGSVVAELAKNDTVAVIVRLREQADMSALAAEARARGRTQGRKARVATVVESLRATAERTQPAVRGLLRAEEAAGRARDIRSFWVFNGLAATVDEAALERLAVHPAVESIALDAVLTVPEVESAPKLPTWGLEKVNAPKTWGDYGFTGRGVVVGVMDTGVDGGHPALASRYRGRGGDHASSWYVPTGENYATPGDGHGHGTHVTGSIVGGGPGEIVGVAPEAEWIAAKIFRDTGSTTTSIIHDAFQWMLAPGGDPAKAPHVVNNSWGSSATYSTEYLAGVRAWIAAGIFPAFANGNAGPGSGTVGSPGSFPESFGVGATDVNDFVASFSSRGPVVWDGVTHIKPQVSAPGHQIYSAWPRQLGRDYHTISGTSMATPHLAGVVALLLSAQPGLTVDAVRDLLTSTARREPHMGRLPNNDYGHGIADAYAAVTAARFSGTLTGTVTGPGGPVAGARVAVPGLDVATETDAAGAYELRLREGSWQVHVSAYGYVEQTAAVTIAAQAEETRDFALTAAPTHTLSGTVTADGSPLPGARVRVAGTPLDTAYTGPDGSFSLTVAAGSYEVSAEATGYRRVTQSVELDADRALAFSLERLPGAVSPEWREYQNNAARTGLSAEELAAGSLTRSWSVRNSGQIAFGSPTIAGGRVYVAHTTGVLRALDLDDGSVLWSVGTSPNFRTTPAVAGGRVFVGGGDSGVFHALDAATGAPVWSHSTGDRLTYTTPTVADGTVYFGTGWGTGNGGWVYALDAANGALRWKSFVGAQVYFAPAVGGGRVYAASYDARRLVALDAATGEELWAHTRTSDSFAAMPSYDGGHVYVATNNFDTGAGSVLALDAETGEKLWEATGHGDGAGNAPAVFGDVVIAGSSINNWVVAYERATGARRWVHSAGAAVSNSQLVADGVLVGGSQQDRRVWALDASTGELLWEDAMTDNVLSAPALADGRLVVADRSGTVRAYEAPGTVAGTVTDASGAPLAAEVRVAATGVSVQTDPETGAFELPHRAGDHLVEAVAYGYVSASAELTIRSGQRLEQSFTLAPAEAGALRGTVADEAGGALAGARVELSGTMLGAAESGEDGSFAFAAVAEGTYELVASLPGYVTLRRQVTVAAGEETIESLTLLRYQIAVTGDRDGAISQYLRGKGYRVESTTAGVVADHPGAYELIVANGSQDDPGQETFLRLVGNADGAETSVIFLDTWGLSYGALWHLIKYSGDPSQRASGYNDGEVSLVARTEHPLTEGLAPGTRVPVLTNNKEWASFSGYSGRSLADVFVGRAGGTTGTGIGYQARTLGSVHVLLSLHAASPWTGPFSGWTNAGARVFDNAVSYALDASFGAVEGTVTAASGGAPIAAKVTAVGSGDSATAGADGQYRLLLPPGEHTLRFERIGYVAEERTIAVAARETQAVDVALASSGAGGITGRVTSSADGTPVAGATVEVLETDLEPATADADGNFAIDGVPGGTYDLQVTAPGFRSSTVEVEVEDGSATDVAVQLSPALRVAVIGDFLTGGENKLTKFLRENEIDAAATQWEAIANLEAYDLVIANNPSDPGAAAFRAHLEALDAAGKSAIFLHGPLSTSGGVRLLRNHIGDPAGPHRSLGSTTAGDRYFRPLGAAHPIFDGVPTTADGTVHALASGRAAGYFEGYSGIQLAQFGVGTTDLGEGIAYEPRTPTSVRLLVSGLAATTSAHPELGWTEPGKQMLLNAVEWAANPGLGSVGGRVVDAAGDPVDTASVRIVETDKTHEVDEDGGFLVPHAPGEWTLEVSAYGYATRELPVQIEAGRTTQLEIELAIGTVGAVSGTVTGRGTISGASTEGPPLEGAQVRLLGHPRVTTTAEDGAYTLANVEPGTYDLQVDANGYVRQVFQVTVAAGETARRDAVLRPSPRVAVVDDCQQTANCVDKLQRYLDEWGYVPEEIDWADHGRLGEFDLVVANLGDFPRLDPGAEGLAAFQDSANRAHVPVIWLEQYQRGSIRWLSQYEGDPVSVGEARSQGLVQAEIAAGHPLTEGFAVGERVPIVTGSGEHTWFNGYSGTTVAGLRTETGGLKGSAIAYKGRTASSVDVLFSSFAVSFYTWPPVGDEAAQRLTPQAERLFHNALNWSLDAPPLAAEARGSVRSSGGGTLESSIEVLETGKSYPGRDGDGTFLVPLQPGTWTLEVTAFGHEPQQIPVTVAAGDVRQLTVTLQSNEVGALTGTIADPAGTPLEGASVTLDDTPLAGTSSATGAYRIERVPVGTHTMVVRKSGYAIARLEVTIAAGETTRQDVRLETSRPVAIAGDFQGRLGEFLTDSGYAVRQWSWTNVHQHIDELQEVDLVILNGSGAAPSAANLTAFVQAAAGADRSLILGGQFGMGAIRAFRNTFGDPQAFTQGFVATATYYRPSVAHPIFDGFPVGEPIEIARSPNNQQYEFFTGYSGETIATVGSATAVLGGGVAYKFATPTSVHVLLDSLGATGTYGYPGERWTDDALRIYLNAVDWAMDAAQAQLTGTVRSGGEPVGGATVQAVEAGFSARTLVDGTYRLGLTAGTHTIRVSAPGYEPFEETVEVGDEGAFVLDVELAAIPRGAVAGTVTDAQTGAAVGGADVELRGPQESDTSTGADGAFAFANVVPGDYTVTVRASGYLPRSISVAVAAGETSSLTVQLRGNDVGVLGDVGGALVDFLRAEGRAAQELDWPTAAAGIAAFDVVVVNGGEPTAGEFEALVAAADAAGTSLVFTGTWGVLNGGIRLLAQHRPDEVEIGGQGYREGEVLLTGFDGAHPLFAGLAAPFRPVATDGYFSYLGHYAGPYLARLSVEGDERGIGVAYDFRSAQSVHLLLSAGAVTGAIGPGYGWTADGEKLFLNAIAWAKDAEQSAPDAPTLETEADELMSVPALTLTGTAEFRSTVTVLRGGSAVAEVEPARDGTFSVEVTLEEGPNVFTAVAENYAGSSPASAAVTVTLDTTAPTLTWTPADGTGFFTPQIVVGGRATDTHAGVAEVLVNGTAASLKADGNFAADVTLAPGANEIVVLARDRVGNEVSETRSVAYFAYATRWTVSGAQGQGEVNVFLDITDAAARPVQVHAARAELVRADGTVAVSAEMRYSDGRYRASLGRPEAGTYQLRGVLVVEGWNVVAPGPAVVRPPVPVPPRP